MGYDGCDVEDVVQILGNWCQDKHTGAVCMLKKKEDKFVILNNAHLLSCQRVVLSCTFLFSEVSFTPLITFNTKCASLRDLYGSARATVFSRRDRSCENMTSCKEPILSSDAAL